MIKYRLCVTQIIFFIALSSNLIAANNIQSHKAITNQYFDPATNAYSLTQADDGYTSAQTYDAPLASNKSAESFFLNEPLLNKDFDLLLDLLIYEGSLIDDFPPEMPHSWAMSFDIIRDFFRKRVLNNGENFLTSVCSSCNFPCLEMQLVSKYSNEYIYVSEKLCKLAKQVPIILSSNGTRNYDCYWCENKIFADDPHEKILLEQFKRVVQQISDFAAWKIALDLLNNGGFDRALKRENHAVQSIIKCFFNQPLKGVVNSPKSPGRSFFNLQVASLFESPSYLGEIIHRLKESPDCIMSELDSDFFQGFDQDNYLVEACKRLVRK
jgi:hypothetical protein